MMHEIKEQHIALNKEINELTTSITNKILELKNFFLQKHQAGELNYESLYRATNIVINEWIQASIQTNQLFQKISNLETVMFDQLVKETVENLKTKEALVKRFQQEIEASGKPLDELLKLNGQQLIDLI